MLVQGDCQEAQWGYQLGGKSLEQPAQVCEVAAGATVYDLSV
jgi:hypothetical protein